MIVVFEGAAASIEAAEKALHEAGVDVTILKRGA